MEFLIPLVLILVGLGLISVEVYLIPGFNVIGILGFLSLIFGIGVAFSAGGLIGGVMATLGAGLFGGSMGYWMWKSGAWDQFILTSSVPPDRQLIEKTQENRSRYLGQVGTALTPLRPTGVAEVKGDRVEVVTEGAFIAAGSAIRVVAMDRRRVFVRLSGTETDTREVSLPPDATSSAE